MLRSKASKVFRDFLDDEGFVDVETPILTKSSPEGAQTISYRAVCTQVNSLHFHNLRKFTSSSSW